MPEAPQIPCQTPTIDDRAHEEEARRQSQLAFDDRSPSTQRLVVSIGERFSTVVRADGRQPNAFRIVKHAPVMLAASQAMAASASGNAAARVVRAAAQQVAERARLEILCGISCPVVGAAGIARTVVALASGGGSTATLQQVHGATNTLAATWVDGKRAGPPHAWAATMMVGSAVLGAILDRLGQTEITTEPVAQHDRAVDVG